MNYLGHAVLSFGNAGILTGNMTADHVKGRLPLETLPEDVKKGILLHRKIDTYTDAHPATMRAKVWFRQDYGLYSGPVLDVLYDHFLANDPKYFPSEKDLHSFSQDTYRMLEENSSCFPERFAAYFPYMRGHNWLYGYRTLQGMQRALGGLERRAKHIPPVENAYRTFIAHFYELNQCYFELMDDVAKFVKIELTQ